MKKFRLKPLRELRQKFSINGFLIGLVVALSVSACSNDENENIAPTFPEKQIIESGANSTKELTFEASADWQLTTSATWCRFVVGENEEYSLSGSAGQQTITLKITDEAQQPDAKSIAQITLMIGAQKAVIADVARNAKDLFLTVYDADGNEIGEDGVINVGYKDYNSFKVKANFRFAATNRPEWLDLQGGSLIGSVNKEVVSGVRVVEEAKFFKYTQEGKITFADEKGLYSKSYTLAFNGMDRDEIKVTRPTQLAWDWTVSLDGKTFSQAGGSSPTGGTSGGTTYMYGVPYTVSAFGDEFETVYIEDKDDSYIVVEDWITLDGKDGNTRLTVQPATAERTGYVFVFTKSEYETIKDKLVDNIFPNGEINYRYEQSNLLMQFTQKESKPSEDEEEQFKVTNALTMKDIECSKYTGGDSEYFKTTYNVNSIYEVKQPSESVNADAIFEISSFKCYYWDNEAEDNSGICEQINATTVNAFIKGMERDIFITVFDSNGKGKMIIIRASNQGGGTGGGEGEVPFDVSSDTGAIACTPLDDTWTVEELSLNGLYEITAPSKSMNINTSESFTITDFQCLDNVNNLNPVNGDFCALPQGEWTPFNIWLENVPTEELLVVITDGTLKYGILIRNANQF